MGQVDLSEFECVGFSNAIFVAALRQIFAPFPKVRWACGDEEAFSASAAIAAAGVILPVFVVEARIVIVPAATNMDMSRVDADAGGSVRRLLLSRRR